MKKLPVLIFILYMFSNNVFAITECRVKTSQLYIGDNGALWMTFIGGGVANMNSSDVDFERTYSMLLAAQLSDKEITVRFQADSAECNSGIRSDIAGVWLHK